MLRLQKRADNRRRRATNGLSDFLKNVLTHKFALIKDGLF